jgi:hypothetical protein
MSFLYISHHGVSKKWEIQDDLQHLDRPPAHKIGKKTASLKNVAVMEEPRNSLAQ